MLDISIYIGINAHVTLEDNGRNVKIKLEVWNRIRIVFVFVIVFVSFFLVMSYF